MKKQYIRYGTIFGMVVLMAFAIAFFIYTGNKIKEYNNIFYMPFVTANIDDHDDNADHYLEQKVIKS